jgi:hypothetical protein
MQELMFVAARIVRTSRYIKPGFGKNCHSLHAYDAVYQKLVYG